MVPIELAELVALVRHELRHQVDACQSTLARVDRDLQRLKVPEKVVLHVRDVSEIVDSMARLLEKLAVHPALHLGPRSPRKLDDDNSAPAEEEATPDVYRILLQRATAAQAHSFYHMLIRIVDELSDVVHSDTGVDLARFERLRDFIYAAAEDTERDFRTMVSTVDASDLLRKLIAAKGGGPSNVRIVDSLSPVPEIWCDYKKFGRALSALFENGLRSAEARTKGKARRGVLTLSSSVLQSDTEDIIQLSFEDSGPPLDKDITDAIIAGEFPPHSDHRYFDYFAAARLLEDCRARLKLERSETGMNRAVILVSRPHGE